MDGTARVTASVLVIAVMSAANIAGAQVGRMVLYGDTTSNIPKMRIWDGSAWSSASAALDVGANPRWVVLTSNPVRTEAVAAVGDSLKDINLLVFNGSSWGHPLEAGTNLGTSADRPFYIAYEQVSGDALVVYRVGGTDATFYYRTWNGTSWSSQGTANYPGKGDAKFIKLVPKPDSNEIMALVLDSKRDLSALVWNGSAFGHEFSLHKDASTTGNEEMDAAYERLTGRCIVAWAVEHSAVPAYSIWTGSTWLTSSTMPSVGGSVKWMRLAADPASNKIIAVTLDGSSDINTATWNGSAWGSVLELDTSAPNTDRRAVDVAFEASGTRALAVYGRSGQNRPYYRVFDGTSWTAAATGPDIANPPGIVQLMPSTSGQEIFIGIERKNDGALSFMRWTGSAIADAQLLAGDLGGPNANECFMFGGTGSAATKPRITHWRAVAPE